MVHIRGNRLDCDGWRDQGWLTSLHRVRRSAIAGNPIGAVDEAELRTICERLLRVSDLDSSNLIARKAAELMRQLAQRESGA